MRTRGDVTARQSVIPGNVTCVSTWCGESPAGRIDAMDVLRGGHGLVESPRWHDGRLWYSDWTAGQIWAIDDAATSELMVEHTSLPLCFDFLPDGRLVLVSNPGL